VTLDNPCWFAIQTRPHWEKTVAGLLESKSYEPFLPLYRCRRRWSDRIRELELPLFSGYLFCRLSPLQRTLPVLTTPGVQGILGIGRRPTPIPDHEVAMVQAIVKSGLPAHPWPFLAVGQRVRINHGSLTGYEGILIASKKEYRLVVSVETVQRSVAVEIDAAWVEPARPLARVAAA
jgi:transcription antitermination factor NusG